MYKYETLNSIHDFAALVEEENKKTKEDYELVPAMGITHTNKQIADMFQDTLGSIGTELVVYGEDPPEMVSNLKMVKSLYGTPYNINQLASLQEGNELIKSITDVAKGIYNSDPDVIMQLSSTVVFTLGEVADTLKINAMEQFKMLPEQIKQGTIDKIYKDTKGESKMTQLGASVCIFRLKLLNRIFF